MPHRDDSIKLAEVAQETALMRRMGAGDREAFAEVIRVQQQRVWTVALRYMRHRDDAEDITQEVFIRLWKAAPQWQPTARLSTWLYRVTANL
jgi:RNA polymerase sigma-70 factor, ECF subfamily